MNEIYSMDELVYARAKDEYTNEIKERILAGDVVQLQDGTDVCLVSLVNDLDPCVLRKFLANVVCTPSNADFIATRNDKADQLASSAANSFNLAF